MKNLLILPIDQPLIFSKKQNIFVAKVLVLLLILFQPTFLASDAPQFDWNNIRNKESISAAEEKTDSCSDNLSGMKNLLHPTTGSMRDATCTQACVSSLRRSLSNSLDLLPTSSSTETCPLHAKWHKDSIPTEAYLSTDVAPKQTSCEIEVDILAADIMNRYTVVF